ncbi:glycoside hydrolase family 3 protein [Mycetocola spongiae]|uniref:glycoside hydrolase family 3 protein n=1 Tax=Mycetocola spongiae TaxID=2859226 RepID=UPI001CF27061|nr:glycoside hydrolase family 3 N-terminal domain-containing protein [Mycetocola spongiae]UCR88672.1 glycoside hydrolase family 3 protein [Mycetocola spongiae]
MITEPNLTRLVNGVLWPGFLGQNVPDWVREALGEGLAGVVYFGHNLDQDNPAAVADLSAKFRAIAPDVLLGVDEEGGTVTRLEAAAGSSLPGPAQLTVLGDLVASAAVGAELGRRAAAVGINVVLGPVADVNTNPANPVIGVRSFGSDPEIVSAQVAATITGMQGRGVAACAKHFPGHGDTHSDSHTSLPRIDVPEDEIIRDHLAPFRAAIAAGVEVIMTAHIIVPAWGELPATLNPVALGRLRDMGFEGVIVTDALDMAAVRESVGAGPGAVLAIRAGADLLCIGNPVTKPGEDRAGEIDRDDYLEVRDALIEAVRSGELDPELLRVAGERNLALARRLAAQSALGRAELSAADAAAMVAGAIRTTGDISRSGAAVTLLDLRDRVTIAVAADNDAFGAALRPIATPTRMGIGVLGGENPAAALAAVLETIPENEDLLVLVDRIGIPGKQREALAAIAAAGLPAVVVNVGITAPGYDGAGLARIDALAGSALSARRVAELIYGVDRA